jgi:hypothetical protein
MSDDRDLDGLSTEEAEVARRLAELGPLMREQEQAEVELDPMFAVRLRAHLVHGEEFAPHPTFARNLRARLLRRRGARPVRDPRKVRWGRWLGTSALATIVLWIVLVVTVLHRPPSPASTFVAPLPRKADLVFSFPSVPVVIHRLLPTLSLVHPRSGVPYAGHLQLTASRLPRAPSTLPAYRLAPPPHVVGRGRLLLGIHAPVKRVTVNRDTWLVAADGGVPSRQPLHSLAVSLTEGELIYHDRRNNLLPHATAPLGRRMSVSVARTWLARLGWPGHVMPVRFIGTVVSRPKVRIVVLGWPKAGPAATEAATLWVTPNGSVIEAWVWPPIVQRGVIPARPIPAAWADVHTGRLPLAVRNLSSSTRAPGVGQLRTTKVLSVLTRGPHGALYLVPTYQFAGTVHTQGTRQHQWYSLAPSAQH